MPRLTNDQYLQRHRGVRETWQRFPETFVVLKPHEQWQVHQYYQSQLDADDDTLSANRQAMTAADPSLPQAAIKALALLTRAFQHAIFWAKGDVIRLHEVLNWVADQRMPIRPGQQVVIHGIVQPEPDPGAIARAILHLVDQQLRDEDREGEAEVDADVA